MKQNTMPLWHNLYRNSIFIFLVKCAGRIQRNIQALARDFPRVSFITYTIISLTTVTPNLKETDQNKLVCRQRTAPVSRVTYKSWYANNVRIP